MEGYVGRRVMGTEMQRKKRIARQKKRLLDSVRADLMEKGLLGKAHDRATWKRIPSHIDLTQKWGRMNRKKKI